MNDEMIETIRYHIENKMLIRVDRSIPDSYQLHGFPLFVSREILIMTNIYNFRDEGVIVLKTDDISEAYSKEKDAFFEKMCRAEGLDTRENPFPACTTMRDVPAKAGAGAYVTVECEREDSELCFSIGTIVETTPDAVIMNNFDVSGQWDDEPRTIPYEKITKISYGDNYCETYRKYLGRI